VWYPSDTHAARQEVPLDQHLQDLRVDLLRARFGPDVAAAMKNFTVHESTDAPVQSGKSRFPVLLFVPGLSWLATDYSVIIDDLVSHGYVIVGISPAGFSEPVEFPDGRITKRSLAFGEKAGIEQSIEQDDALFALGKIRAMNDTGFLSGRIDTKKIGAFGHSLGGTTALVVAARDTAVRAAINIDGDPMGDVREVRPHQPVLLISSESPTVDTTNTKLSVRQKQLIQEGLERSEKRRTDDWSAISSQSASAHRITIPGAYHLNFEDAALASGLLTDRQARWMKFGTIEPERALASLNQIVRTFFDESFGRLPATNVFAKPDRSFPGTR
jgi:predicted dienelactone hydrolase